MIISIIAAMANRQIIGNHNQIPWHLPADMKYFKEITMGKPIIMGRKTFESIGKPLPGRRNIIVTHQKELSIPGCEVVNSLDDAITLTHQQPEIMIIGGAQLYQAALPRANKLYITKIDANIEGDTKFPTYDQSEWQLESEQPHPADEKNPFPYSFCIYSRITNLRFAT